MSNPTEAGNVFSAVNSIDYSSNAVVSKTILKKPSGNVSLFSFDEGEGLASIVHLMKLLFIFWMALLKSPLQGKVKWFGKTNVLSSPLTSLMHLKQMRHLK